MDVCSTTTVKTTRVLAAAYNRKLKRPADGKAFSQATRQLTHDPAEARLPDVKAPVLVVMGDKDPDFKDPVAEARWIGNALRGEVVGHRRRSLSAVAAARGHDGGGPFVSQQGGAPRPEQDSRVTVSSTPPLPSPTDPRGEGCQRQLVEADLV